MSKEKPVIYIFHGDDLYSMERAVEKMVSAMGDPATASLNYTRLDGKTASLEQLHAAANAMPFLAERRLVVVSNPFSHISNQNTGEQKNFCAFLDRVPPSTALVLMVEDRIKNKKVNEQWQSAWDVLKESHWLMRWQRDSGQRVLVTEFQLPSGGAMSAWIQKQAQEYGGTFSASAAQTLAGYVGSDTRQAMREIEKLLAYVNWERPVEPRDVKQITVVAQEASVFDMVDALAMGSLQPAARLLQDLLEQEDPLMVFGMIIRQFRLLIQSREILDEGGGAAQIRKELQVLNFVAQNLERQAARFTLTQLLKIYHRLLDLDEGFKTSKMPPDLGMNLFIAKMSG